MWGSVNIYYKGRYHETIKSYTETYDEHEIFLKEDDWFFLWYVDEIGEHIRLRWLVRSDIATSIVGEMKHLNCRVGFEMYKPEYMRYGGVRYEMEFHELFNLSSRVVLTDIWKRNSSCQLTNVIMVAVLNYRIVRKVVKSRLKFVRHMRDERFRIAGLIDVEKGFSSVCKEKVLSSLKELSSELHVTKLMELYFEKMLVYANMFRINCELNKFFLAIESMLHMNCNRYGLSAVEEALVCEVIMLIMENEVSDLDFV